MRDLLHRRPLNFREVMAQRALGVDPATANGNFLDAFYAAKPRQRQSFIEYEPIPQDGYDVSCDDMAEYAAEAEKLAHDFNLRVPTWTEKPQYFLDRPLLAGRPIGELRPELVKVMRDDSPPEFRRRNLYVSNNVLTRM
ncbi:MAG: hypothetical protein LBL67_04285 [Coriobacteriales bacterium]|jgi:hypothetical protein|nr:hypothetical protein [Coriobacteriales bacterium]